MTHSHLMTKAERYPNRWKTMWENFSFFQCFQKQKLVLQTHKNLQGLLGNGLKGSLSQFVCGKEIQIKSLSSIYFICNNKTIRLAYLCPERCGRNKNANCNTFLQYTHCDRIHFSLTYIYCFDDCYVEKQP